MCATKLWTQERPRQRRGLVKLRDRDRSYGRLGEERGAERGVERGADLGVERGAALGVERGAALGVERGAALGVERGAALVGVRDGTRTLGRGDAETPPWLGVVLRSRVGLPVVVRNALGDARPVVERPCPEIWRVLPGAARPVGATVVVVRRPAVLVTVRPVGAPLAVVRLS